MHQEFTEVDFELARLSNLVGSRMADMDPIPVFAAIGDLTKEIAALTKGPEEVKNRKQLPMAQTSGIGDASDYVKDVTGLGVRPKDIQGAVDFAKTFGAAGGFGEALRKAMGQEVTTSFKPTIELFSKLSSDKTAPGDLLDAELANIRREMSDVKALVLSSTSGTGAAVSTNSGGAASTGVSWNLGSISLGLGSSQSTQASTIQSTTSGVVQPLAQIKSLEARVQDIEDQLHSQTVSIAGLTFKSQLLTRAWMTTNAPAAGAYIYFLDGHGMLSLASDEVDTTRAVLSFCHSATKGGYALSEEAQVLASFKIALPAIFGSDSASTKVSADTRTLPALKVFEVWDPEDGYTGAKRRFDEQIKEVKATMLESVGDHLVGIGRTVAMECIQAAYESLRKLSEWMS
jgi:hypothetical protein